MTATATASATASATATSPPTPTYETDLDAGIQQALENGDLPTLALLMEQRRHAPLMLAAQRVYAARKTLRVVEAHQTRLGELAQEWGSRRADLQRSIGGALYDRNADYITADLVVKSLAQYRGLLTEQLANIKAGLHKAEPTLATAIAGEGVAVLMPEVEAGAASLWQRITDDLARYGVDVDVEAA